MRAKRQSDGLALFSLEYTPKNFIKNIKTTAECKLAYHGTIRDIATSGSLEYRDQNLIAKISLIENKPSVRASFITGSGETGFGLDTTYDITLSRLSNYNLALW